MDPKRYSYQDHGYGSDSGSQYHGDQLQWFGRGIDFTDKRGIQTTYGVDNFGRFSGAAFNANNVSGYLPFGVFPGPITSWPNALYDPLDRPYALTSWYTNGGIQYDTIAYTYDGVDNVLSEAETPGTYNFYTNTPGPTSPTLNFTYDENGRRTQLTSTLNGYSMPTINYGYDCADELVSMSNDGSQLPSCGPSTNVSYTGNTSTQTAYNYDMDGGLANTIANGIQTVFSLDVDERPILQTFQTVGGGCPGSPPSCFGTLSYGYDLDGRVQTRGELWRPSILRPTKPRRIPCWINLPPGTGTPSATRRLEQAKPPKTSSPTPPLTLTTRGTRVPS